MTTPRRSYSAEFKAKIALDAVKGCKTSNELATEHGIPPNPISQWRTQPLEAVPTTCSERTAPRE